MVSTSPTQSPSKARTASSRSPKVSGGRKTLSHDTAQPASLNNSAAKQRSFFAKHFHDSKKGGLGKRAVLTVVVLLTFLGLYSAIFGGQSNTAQPSYRDLNNHHAILPLVAQPEDKNEDANSADRATEWNTPAAFADHRPGSVPPPSENTISPAPHPDSLQKQGENLHVLSPTVVQTNNDHVESLSSVEERQSLPMFIGSVSCQGANVPVYDPMVNLTIHCIGKVDTVTSPNLVQCSSSTLDAQGSPVGVCSYNEVINPPGTIAFTVDFQSFFGPSGNCPNLAPDDGSYTCVKQFGDLAPTQYALARRAMETIVSVLDRYNKAPVGMIRKAEPVRVMPRHAERPLSKLEKSRDVSPPWYKALKKAKAERADRQRKALK